jgi:hypothetical protein
MNLTEQRMMEIAGIDPKAIAKKKTVKEDAATDLAHEFGSIGEFVAQQLDIYADQMTDPDVAGELEGQETPESLQGFVKDMANDMLIEVFRSEAYKRYATEIAGQINQANQQPDQGVMNI